MFNDFAEDPPVLIDIVVGAATSSITALHQCDDDI